MSGARRRKKFLSAFIDVEEAEDEKLFANCFPAERLIQLVSVRNSIIDKSRLTCKFPR